MKCPHCKNDIGTKDLPNDIHTVAFKIIIERMWWMFPEHTEPWVFSEILINAASAVTQAFCNIIDGNFDGEHQSSLFEEQEREAWRKNDELKDRLKKLEVENQKLKDKLKIKFQHKPAEKGQEECQ